MLRKLFLLTVALAVGGFALADNAARVFAEHQIEKRADQYYPHENGSSAQIAGWPFTVRLLAAGEVKQIKVNLYGVVEHELFVRRISVILTGVKLDRNSLFKRKVRLRDLDSGRVEVDVDGPSLAKRVGRDVRFHDGSVEVHGRVAGRDVVATGTLAVADNVVRFTPTSVEGQEVPAAALAGLGFSSRLPTSDLWPCTADARPIEGGLLVGCRIDTIPARLVGAELDVRPGG